jgi:diguanylate cyclase (GGDEF)-like protein/PAS domain S-box-containing protein
LLIALILLGLLLYDSRTPLALGGGLFYIAAVLLALRLPWPREVVIVAVSASLITILGFFLSPTQAVIPNWAELLNRLLALAAIWLTTLLGLRLRQTSRRELEKTQWLNASLLSIADAVIITDSDGRVSFMNPVAESLCAWTLSEALDHPAGDVLRLFDADTRAPLADPISQCLSEQRIIKLTAPTLLVSRNGSELHVQDSVAPIRDPQGHMTGAVLVFSDVSQQHRLQQELVHQAAHDALTGLINRREFESRLQRVVISAQTDASAHTLVYMDLDQFKVVNDSCGHAAGDELLRQVTGLFLNHVRQRDTLARLGGDEFAVLMEHCTVTQAERIADKLRGTVEEFRFVWHGKSFKIGVSIGLVAVDATTESHTAALLAADSACYMAKQSGRNRVYLYRADNADLVLRQHQLHWAARFNQALHAGRLQLWAQPIVPLSDTAAPGICHELLIRLLDETGQLIEPGTFIPALERYHLSGRLDRWVITTAFEYFARCPGELQKLALCTINLSGRALGDEAFEAFVLEKLLKSENLIAGKICFEITETAAIANLGNAERFIRRLQQSGCRFALDDFGSGLASFAYLKKLPVDFLKIDGSFVCNIADDPIDFAMVEAINTIGKIMGKQTIAESVETPAVLQRLQQLGVDYVQGYGVARPQFWL